ncbi:ATP-binding protein [Streptomyces sp. NPDC001832]|uniref:ATP-binding protein n=1 Tax=Streptomyces sp. NPDC001832 TaxID=3154527 RepID=UPI003327201B
MATPNLAEEAVEVILDGHQVQEEVMLPALLLVHELVSYACRFTGAGDQIHLALGRAAGVLQVAVYDTHAAHAHPRLAAACEERRRAALVGVPELVEKYLGTWGFGAGAYPPGDGMCTWATLVHAPQGRVA